MVWKSSFRWLGGLSLLGLMLFLVVVLAGCDRNQETVLGPSVESFGQAPADTVGGRIDRPGVEPANASDWTRFPWPGPDWSSRVHWEARKALGRNRVNGTSDWPIGGGQYLGDWNYIFSDTYAKKRIDLEDNSGIGSVGYVATVDPYRHNCGGWCTYFVRTILYRSSYWAGYKWNGKSCHLTMPNFGGSVYGWCNYTYMNKNFGSAKPGWVLINPDPGKQHYAILDQWTGTGWWVIDSNWLGTYRNSSGIHYSYYIGKHFMPLSKLQGENWWVWAPTLATTN